METYIDTAAAFSIAFKTFHLCRLRAPLDAISPHSRLPAVDKTCVAISKAQIRAGRIAQQPDICVVHVNGVLPPYNYSPPLADDGFFGHIVSGDRLWYAIKQIVEEDQYYPTSPSLVAEREHAWSSVLVEVYSQELSKRIYDLSLTKVLNNTQSLHPIPRVEMHDAWRMVRRVPTGAVWKTLECLNLGYLHKLAVHKAAWDAVDVLVGCPALRKGLNRTNVDVIFNQGGVIEISLALFQEAIETIRRLAGNRDVSSISVLDLYGYKSSASPPGKGCPTTSSGEEFWKALYEKKKELWTTFEASEPQGSIERIKELFHRATTRGPNFCTLLRSPNDSVGPFPGGFYEPYNIFHGDGRTLLENFGRVLSLTLMAVLQSGKERGSYQFSRFGEKSEFLLDEYTSETRVFTWVEVVKKMMRCGVISDIVTDERQLFWSLSRHHEDLARHITCFSESATTNSSASRASSALNDKARTQKGEEVGRTNQDLLRILLSTCEPWKSWIGTYFIPLFPPMAQDGALCPFFTLRSGVEFQYASLRPHLPASTGALAHSPSYAASNSGNEYPALECVYDNRPGEFSLSQSAVAPFDTFFLGGACHTEETYAEGGQQTYQDARIFPPQYPIPRMADSNTPADSVCRFMSEHGLLPPGAAETIRPLIHHILQPAVLIDIQQGSVSVVNAINALSIEHDLVPENQHINLNEGMNALNHCGTLMQQNQEDEGLQIDESLDTVMASMDFGE